MDSLQLFRTGRPFRSDLSNASVAAAILFLGLVGGCGKDAIFCTEEEVPGVVIRVYDSVTGEPAVCGAEAWLASGEYYEDISDRWECEAWGPTAVLYVQGAGERPGRYTAVILKEGYAPWIRTDIVVDGGSCHVRQVELEAALVPLD